MRVAMQHGSAARGRRIPVETQQGIEPEQPATVAHQPLQLAREIFRLPGVKPVGDQQHQRAAADQPASVLTAQGGQRVAQPRASGEVVDRRAGGLQHRVGVGQPERRRQVGEMGAESEYVAPPLRPRGSVQESQQQARIALHRPRDIHQHQQRQRLLQPAQPGELQQLAAGAGRPPHHAWPVQPVAVACRPPAPRREPGHGQRNVAGELLDQVVFGAAQGAEVRMLQGVEVAGRHGRVEIDLLVRLVGSGAARQFRRGQRFTHAGSAFAGLGLALGAREQLRQQLVRHLRVAKIGVEQFAKDLPVLLAADHHGLEGGAQVTLVCDADQPRSLRRQCDAFAVGGDARSAQRAAKARDVVRKFPGACVTQLHDAVRWPALLRPGAARSTVPG